MKHKTDQNDSVFRKNRKINHQSTGCMPKNLRVSIIKRNIMKNLVKAGSLLLFALISFPTFSQFKVGVKAGLNIATIHQNFTRDYDYYEIQHPVPRLLYSVGLCSDISFGDWVSLQPALLFGAKGVGINVKKEYEADKGYMRFTANYLEIPINVVGKYKGFQAYAGPYIAFALSGKNKWDMEADGETDSGSEKIEFVWKEVDPADLDSEYEFFVLRSRRLDYGLNIGVGYKLGPVLFNAGYSLGLANMTPSVKGMDEDEFDPKDAKRSTRTVTISVSYFFGKEKE